MNYWATQWTSFEAVLKKSLYMWGDCTIPVPYKVRGTIRVTDSYKVPAFYICYGGTIRVIDSYKVPAVDSNHKDTSL